MRSSEPWGLRGGVTLAAILALTACSNGSSPSRPSVGMEISPQHALSSPPAATRRTTSAGRPAQLSNAEFSTTGRGGYKLGKPYSIGGVWYVPREEPNYDRTGVGSWYGADFHGKATANGEIYNMDALTAAHPTLPIPSYVHVTNLANNRTILVRVNDRGPYIGGRMIDLSRAAARALGYETMGTANVRVQYAGRAPLNFDDSRERHYLAAQPWHRSEVAQQLVGPPVWQSRLEPDLPSVPSRPEPNAVWSPDAYRRTMAQPAQAQPHQPARSSWLPSWGLGAQ